MDEATVALMVMSFLIFLIFAGFLVWGIKSGQFRNVEEAKYKMLDDVTPADDNKEAKEVE